MDDEHDVEALLEAPFQRKEKSDAAELDNGISSRSDKNRHRSKRRSRSRDRKKRKHSKDRRSRSRDRPKSRRSRSRDRFDRDDRRGKHRDRPWRSSPPISRAPPVRGGDISGRKLPGPERRDVMPFTPRHSPPRDYVFTDLSPEERDARTVFCMQLARNIRPRDLEEFFSPIAKVRDVRIITDSKTRRSKGIAYVEFWDLDSVPKALSLHGKRLLGAPIVVQPTQSEKNRMASAMLATTFGQNRGPMKLYIGSLHFNITEEMIRGIFEPFGKIESVQLMRDPESGRSRGYGFITYYNTDDAKKAMEQLNGFELAGRPMKVGHVTEHQSPSFQPSLDSDEMDRTGIDLGTTGRLQLMAKLAEGTGMELPSGAKQVLNAAPQQGANAAAQPPIATQCFMLSNMFDPTTETDEDWDVNIRDDVIEECNKHQGVVHVYVDKASPDGNVYVKCPSVAAAVAAVNSLHGRYFAGKLIRANYVPTSNYHQLFSDSVGVTKLLLVSYQDQM